MPNANNTTKTSKTNFEKGLKTKALMKARKDKPFQKQMRKIDFINKVEIINYLINAQITVTKIRETLGINGRVFNNLFGKIKDYNLEKIKAPITDDKDDNSFRKKTKNFGLVTIKIDDEDRYLLRRINFYFKIDYKRRYRVLGLDSRKRKNTQNFGNFMAQIGEKKEISVARLILIASGVDVKNHNIVRHADNDPFNLQKSNLIVEENRSEFSDVINRDKSNIAARTSNSLKLLGIRVSNNKRSYIAEFHYKKLDIHKFKYFKSLEEAKLCFNHLNKFYFGENAFQHVVKTDYLALKQNNNDNAYKYGAKGIFYQKSNKNNYYVVRIGTKTVFKSFSLDDCVIYSLQNIRQ